MMNERFSATSDVSTTFEHSGCKCDQTCIAISFIKLLLLIATLIAHPTCLSAKGFDRIDRSDHAFLNKYCIGCHGSDQQKGDRAFDQIIQKRGADFQVELDNADIRILLEEILDQLNLGEMPPDDSPFGMPSAEETKQTVDSITKLLLQHESQKRSGQTVLRRLNRHEYKNTIEDLLGLDLKAVDHTKSFPADESLHGFTNIGEALSVSDAHLEQYLDAADAYLRMAISFRPPQAPRTRWPNWAYPERETRTPWMYRLSNHANRTIDIGAGAKDLSRHYALPTISQGLVYGDRQSNQRIKQPGYYRISFRAQALRRLTHGYDPTMIPTDLKPKMQLGLYVSDGKEGIEAGGVNARSRVALWDLQDDKLERFELTIWLDENTFPFLNWDNGPGSSDYWMRDILKKYHDDIEFRGKEGSHAWHIVGKNAVPGRAVSDVWRGPVIRVQDFAIEGPLPKTFQSLAQVQFFGGNHQLAKVNVKDSLSRLASRAFRRPVSDLDVQPYVDIVKHAIQNLNRSPSEAILIGMKSILVSPDFLYLREVGNPDGSLKSHELANRLSYFLWGSMPDSELRQLADSGEILKPDVLRAQAIRMLANSKSNSLVQRLCTTWLRLDKLGSMPPDKLKFYEYYYYGIEHDMRQETLHFVSHMLAQNRPVSEFLSADYSFLNYNLAKHYGIDGLQLGLDGSEFQKTTLPKNANRGGILGHASILTLTANGVDTSPVVRGVWVLENILGITPSPPPPDVEPLEPDVRGSVTLKQRLEKHKTIDTCRDCHQKFDPLGFPLEFYDAIGMYRPKYRNNRVWHYNKKTSIEWLGAAVDGSAELTSGELVFDLDSLREYLLTRSDRFKQNLGTVLLTMATGRHPLIADQQEIATVLSNAREEMGFRDLVLDVVRTASFARR